jgi:hypothetical protein
MTVPLLYAPPVRRSWRRRLTVAGVALCAAAAGVLGYRHVRPTLAQARYLYWQRQCMRYSARGDFVVYEEDAVRAAAMLAAGPPYQPVNSLSNPRSAGLDGPPAGYVPPPLSRLGGSWVCIAFLHARRLPGGQPRLGLLGLQVHPEPDGGRLLDLYGTGKRWPHGKPVPPCRGRRHGARPSRCGPASGFASTPASPARRTPRAS